MADFVFLPSISFIIAFTASILSVIGKPNVKSLDSLSDLPPLPPLMGQTGVIK